jgi:hypothetical protein
MPLFEISEEPPFYHSCKQDNSQHNEDYVKDKKHTKNKNYRSKIEHHDILVLYLFLDVV